MSEIVSVSTVKEDEFGEPYIELNAALMKQMGWDDQTLLEWEIMGNMAVIRKKEDERDMCGSN
jgi:hypothetical protein